MKNGQRYLPGVHQALSTEEFILIVSPDRGATETELIDPIEPVDPELDEDIQKLQPELFVTEEVVDKANPATTAK